MTDNWKPLFPLADLQEGGMRACAVDGRELVVCRIKDDLYALDDHCTHAAARMSEGRLRGVRLICPLHGACFDVRDGRVLGAPALRPLASHRVRVMDDQVEVAVGPEPAQALT